MFDPKEFVHVLPGEDAFVAALTGDDALVARQEYRLRAMFQANGADLLSLREVQRWEYLGRGCVQFYCATSRPDPRVPVPTNPKQARPTVVGSGYHQTIFRGVAQ